MTEEDLQEKREENLNMKAMLMEKQAEMNAMSSKILRMDRVIDSLENAKAASQASLNMLRNSLRASQRKVIQTFQKEINQLTQNQYNLLQKSDSLENQAISCNDSLTHALRNKKIQYVSLPKTWLEARNILFSDRENDDKADITIRKKNSDKVRMTFDIHQHGKFKKGYKGIYVSLAKPSGETLAVDPETPRNFIFRNRELSYTDKTSLYLKEDKQKVEMEFNFGEEGLEKGLYEVRLYCDNHLIGQSGFKVASGILSKLTEDNQENQ